MQTHMRFLSLAGVAVIVLASYTARFLPAADAPFADRIPSYSQDIQPILESRCILCHGVQKIRNRLDLRTYDSLMAGSQNGAVILPGDANNSLLIQKLKAGEMPKRGPKLFPAQLHKLVDWINAGAPDN